MLALCESQIPGGHSRQIVMCDERVLRAIYSAVDDLNKSLGRGQKVSKEPGAELWSESGKLDSLGIVTLIIGVEEAIEEEFGLTISLAGEHAMSQEKSPFKTVDTLMQYVTGVIEIKRDSGSIEERNRTPKTEVNDRNAMDQLQP